MGEMQHEFPFIVKARYADPRKGWKSEGFEELAAAEERARDLSHDSELSDVMLIEKGVIETIVTKMKGEVWCLLGELNTHFPGRWRMSDAPPLPDVSDEVKKRDEVNEKMLAQMEIEAAEREAAWQGPSVQVSEA